MPDNAPPLLRTLQWLPISLGIKTQVLTMQALCDLAASFPSPTSSSITLHSFTPLHTSCLFLLLKHLSTLLLGISQLLLFPLPKHFPPDIPLAHFLTFLRLLLKCHLVSEFSLDRSIQDCNSHSQDSFQLSSSQPRSSS